MTDASRAAYITRETILKLLSNEEVARVSKAETASELADGAEFLDLEHLDRGVQRFSASTKARTANALPRSAVAATTWEKVIARLVA